MHSMRRESNSFKVEGGGRGGGQMEFIIVVQVLISYIYTKRPFSTSFNVHPRLPSLSFPIFHIPYPLSLILSTHSLNNLPLLPRLRQSRRLRLRPRLSPTRLHADGLAVLQGVDVDARAGEVLPAVDEPLQHGDDEDYEEDYDAVVCWKEGGWC